MRIAAVDMTPFEPRFPGAGFAMSHVVQTQLFGRVIRLTTEDGTIGTGEVARRSKMDFAAAAMIEDARLPRLQGLPLAVLPELLDQWRAEDPALTGLSFALETALLDIQGQRTGMPLSALLGGPAGGSAGAYLSLSSGAPEAMARTVQTRPGHPVVQAKLGVDTIDTDLVRIHAVLDAMEPDQTLLADFNGGLDLDTACRALPTIEDPRLVWEDPCLSYADNAAFARATGAPVMLDMCLKSVPDFLQAIQDRVAASVALKPAFLGSLSTARTARDLCVAAGMPLRVDGPWCGPVAAAASLHLALGTPSDLLICAADLTDPFGFTSSMIRHPGPGQVAVGDAPGLGSIPDWLFEDAL